jgi:hypothetical protein
MLPGKYLLKNSGKEISLIKTLKYYQNEDNNFNSCILKPYTFKDTTNAERSELALKSKGPEAAEKRRRGDYPTFLKCVTLLLGHFWVRRHW